MARTPEGRVKDKVKALLQRFKQRVWYDMPVPAGYGKSTVDFLCCAAGVFFVIETKAYDHQEATARQKKCMEAIQLAGGFAFEICGLDDPDFVKLEMFIISLVGEPDAN